MKKKSRTYPEECNIVFYIKLEHYNLIILLFQKSFQSLNILRRKQKFEKKPEHPLMYLISSFTGVRFEEVQIPRLPKTSSLLVIVLRLVLSVAQQ